MAEMVYPTPERIIELNLLVLSMIRAKKADKPQILNRARLFQVIEDCEGYGGDVYDKAVVLLKGLVQKHPFASGNRRTAFVATKEFLHTNKATMRIENTPENARVMLGIREDYYTEQEIKEWIQHGKIKQFKR